MGKLKAWALEYGMDDADEQQFYAEVMAQQEQEQLASDEAFIAWLDLMNTQQECEQ